MKKKGPIDIPGVKGRPASERGQSKSQNKQFNEKTEPSDPNKEDDEIQEADHMTIQNPIMQR